MKFLVILAFVAVASAASPPAYPAPAYGKTYDYPAQPYTFGYDVNDAPSYNNFGHQEAADGKVVSGSYRVELPDGRTQVVTYKDDGYGLISTVKTEGTIKAYDYKPAYKPAYPAAYPAKY
ncbi:cuticle protein 19.8-like isoform X2 [Daphnia pulex]|uniref:cuticle protein 19.8-like isoform X2 n=1 Tax=Daphnia pulex TaxID=6669 RepID=UPI001EE02F2F|nr:cuticle protein 19.8-like isoform X2 [Daphnia pulex]